MSRLQKRDIPTEVLAASPNRDHMTILNMGSGSRQAFSPPLDPTVLRAMHFVQAGLHEKALSLLDAECSTPQVRNVRGVCLLRLGRYEKALQLFRSLVLEGSGDRVRSDLPTVYLTNLATALLLTGHPSSCLALLDEIDKESHPTVIRLRKEIHQWQATLTFAERLNWWFGRLEPPHCPIVIHFLPGDFDSIESGTSSAPADEVTLPPFSAILKMG
jgi:hypothetical protein